jgi:ADP-ribose pyrophosphatase YjhB (NUDIX family)
MMHDLQKHILKTLTVRKKARFADLKPKTVEGNLFVYHLKTLIREGYIENKDDKYTLTSKGKNFVDRVSFETFKERIQPKIVTLIALKNKKQEYLLYKRTRVPFSGYIGFPYGKIHLEERVADAATRELLEKTGLEATLKHRGDVYITVHDETELISHTLFHIFSGDNPRGNLRTDSHIGECFWAHIEDIPKENRIPGLSQIKKLLDKSHGLFFEEYFLNTREE